MPSLSQHIRNLVWQCKSYCHFTPSLKSKRGIPNLGRLLANFDEKQRYRYQELKTRYSIDAWPKLCSASEYRENLYVLDLLDQHVSLTTEPHTGLDIGCRNFGHLPALSSFRAIPWHGVEIDANARYISGHTRRAHGEWMAHQIPGCKYISGSLLDIGGQYSLITWTLPFVLPTPFKNWGLPDHLFQPTELLLKAWGLLEPGGSILIVNQGESEAAEQEKLFANTGIPYQSLGIAASLFSPFLQPRYMFIATKRH